MMNLEEQVDLLHAAVKHIEPKMAELGMQLLSYSPNNPVAYFSDRSDPCPVVVEYRIGQWAQHSFRVTVRGLVMGITMASPWVQWGDDTFMPRLKRVRYYADALRKALPAP